VLPYGNSPSVAALGKLGKVLMAAWRKKRKIPMIFDAARWVVLIFFLEALV